MKKKDLFTRFDGVFFEKTRLSIMTVLYRERTASFNHMKSIIGGSDGAVYSHLQKLLDAQYIYQKKLIRKESAQTFYFLTDAGRRLFRDYLRFLEGLLDSFEAAGESETT